MNAVTPTENPIGKFRAQLEQRLDTFAEALPPQITPQRFKSIIMWAVTADPGLLAADRVSLFEACLAAANDGLLPDKKEGALVIYNTKVKEDGKEFWIKKVQWMPMIRGIFARLYNTGMVKTAKVEIVYGGDRFRSWTDDAGDHIEYEEGDEQDRDLIRNAFALVVMKDSAGGGVWVQTMKPADIEKIRSKSKKSDSGPWADWWEEMAKKSVFRRLAKRLPMAREIDQVVSRDDYMYDALDAGEYHGIERARAPIPPRPPAAMLGAPTARPMPMDTGRTTREADTIDGDVVDEKPAQSKAAPDKAKPQEQKNSEPTASPGSDSGDGAAAEKPSPGATPQAPAQPGDGDFSREEQIAKSRADGAEAKKAGRVRKSMPAEYRKDPDLSEAWLTGHETGEAERQPGEEG